MRDDTSQHSHRLAATQPVQPIATTTWSPRIAGRAGSRLTRIWTRLYTRPRMGTDTIQPSRRLAVTRLTVASGSANRATTGRAAPVLPRHHRSAWHTPATHPCVQRPTSSAATPPSLERPTMSADSTSPHQPALPAARSRWLTCTTATGRGGAHACPSARQASKEARDKGLTQRPSGCGR